MRRPRLNKTGLGTAAVLVLAAGLGLWGIGHGLPFSYYPDEAHFVKRALSFGSGDLNPHWFHKPAFYMYIVFAEYGVVFLVGKLLGAWSGATEFGVRFVRDPGVFYLVGRLSTLAFAVATVGVVIRLGERHLRPGAGLVGGLVLALTTGFVASSQWVKGDVPSTFFAVLSLYGTINYARSGRWRDLLTAAAAGGASAAIKAYGVALLPALIATVVWRATQSRSEAHGVRTAIGQGLALLACFPLVQFALAPFSFLDPSGRLETFGRIGSLLTLVGHALGISQPTATLVGQADQGNGGFLQSLSDYVRVLVSGNGMGWVLSLYAALGLAALAIRRRFSDFLLIGYVGLFALVSAFVYPGYAEPRHQTPVYPVLAIAAGFAVASIMARLPRYRTLLVAVFAATLLLPLSVLALRAQAISREDTRNAAKYWIEENIPAGSKIVVDETGPPLLASEGALRRSLQAAQEASPTGQFTAHYDTYLDLQIRAADGAVTYELDEIRRPWWLPSEPVSGVEYLTSEKDRDMGNPLLAVGVEPYDAYVSMGYQYAVVSSESYGSTIANPRVAARWPSFAAFYRELFRRGRLVRTFSDSTGQHAGPVVRIYAFSP